MLSTPDVLTLLRSIRKFPLLLLSALIDDVIAGEKAAGESTRQLRKLTISRFATKRFVVVRRLGVTQNEPIASRFMAAEKISSNPMKISPIMIYNYLLLVRSRIGYLIICCCCSTRIFSPQTFQIRRFVFQLSLFWWMWYLKFLTHSEVWELFSCTIILSI